MERGCPRLKRKASRIQFGVFSVPRLPTKPKSKNLGVVLPRIGLHRSSQCDSTLVENSRVARNAEIRGRTPLSPTPEATETARGKQRRSLFALRASPKTHARTFQSQ